MLECNIEVIDRRNHQNQAVGQCLVLPVVSSAGTSLNEAPEIQQLALNFLATFF